MAFTCGFFNSQNGDRKYNAEQMASIFDGLIKDGVYDTIGDIFAVTPGTGMQVLVGSGRAWFDHTWNNNDAQYPLAITAADVSLPRYDAVVLETNHSDTVRTNRLRVLTGTPASNPVKPTMTSTANVKQHPLAYIKVTAGATAITQSMIQVVVGTSECPFVTGIIDTAEIDALFQQWNGEFNEWFENLKAQLSDNVVANLQGQIDQKVAKADVATTADIEAGTSTTKWVTPKGLKEAGISSDGNKVGDVLCTARTDLSDDWALCNGDSILSINASKGLLDIMATSYGKFNLVETYDVPIPNIPSDRTYNTHRGYSVELINGTIIVGGAVWFSGYSGSYPAIWWKTYPNGSWNSVTLSNGSRINTIRYFDEKYIFIDTSDSVVYVAAILTSSTSDYTKISFSNLRNYEPTNLFKFGNYYCFLGQVTVDGSYFPMLGYCTSIDSSISFTGYGGWGTDKIVANHISFFDDGYLYITGYEPGRNYNYPFAIKVPFLPTTKKEANNNYSTTTLLYDTSTNARNGTLSAYWRKDSVH